MQKLLDIRFFLLWSIFFRSWQNKDLPSKIELSEMLSAAVSDYPDI
jgi:hypothetical protein